MRCIDQVIQGVDRGTWCVDQVIEGVDRAMRRVERHDEVGVPVESYGRRVMTLDHFLARIATEPDRTFDWLEP